MSTNSSEPARRRLPREERRRILLRAGAELAREMYASGSLDPLAAVTPTAVIERATAIAFNSDDPISVSKSMLYYLWGDGMEGYRRDLLLELGQVTVDPAGLGEAVEGALGAGIAAIIQRGANYEFRRLGPNGPDHATNQLFDALVTIAVDPLLHEQVRSRIDRSLEEYAALYGAIMELTNRRMVDGITVEQLASCLSATVAGFASEAAFDSRLSDEVERPEADGPWSLFAVTVLSMMLYMTRPADAPS